MRNEREKMLTFQPKGNVWGVEACALRTHVNLVVCLKLDIRHGYLGHVAEAWTFCACFI